MKELTAQDWPQRMMDLLRDANDRCEAARQDQRRLSEDDIAAIAAQYEALLREGEALHPEESKPPGKRGRSKQSIAFNLLRRLRQHADAVLLFTRDLAVPFTNNLGERAVRMPKVKQKVSGCFRTRDGAEHFCVIRSCLDTLRKQGHRMIDVLRHAFAGSPIRPTA